VTLALPAAGLQMDDFAQRVQVFLGDMSVHRDVVKPDLSGHLPAPGQGNWTELASSLDSASRVASFWSRLAERRGIGIAR